MTSPNELRRIRTKADLSLRGLALVLRIGDLSTIHRWEKGDRKVSGPASIVLEMLAAGELPARYMVDANNRPSSMTPPVSAGGKA